MRPSARHCHGPARTIQTVDVSRPKIRNRGTDADGERIRFASAILPRWVRRTESLDALLPVCSTCAHLDGLVPGGLGYIAA